ncbi:hypothetical protein EAI_13693 [Harpegnathos saltator]|uniref:Uncharacterized protein n=2 Tax=Harpegnathos saltator TaxID=610380 RepID=E2C0Y8_HARSA|nr:hypothetical protein EAI_13693 [Harpegnathos saltator]
MDSPKFTRTSQDAPYRNEFTGSSGAEPPKVVRNTSFRNGLMDYRNQNRLPPSYYPSSYYNQKMKPYTMMMPPPMIQKAETSTSYNVGLSKDKVIGYADTSQPFSTQTEEGPLLQDAAQYHGTPSKDYGHYSSVPSSKPYSTSKTLPNKAVAVSQAETVKSVYTPTASQSTRSRYEATTAPSVSFEKSNLIYQSTQTLTGGWLGNNGPTSSSSTGFPDVSQVTWQTSDYPRDHYEADYHAAAAASSNHEVIIGQNANIIVDGNNNENEEVVVGQKEINTDATSSTSESVAQSSTVSSTTITDSTGQEEEQEQAEEAVTETQKMHIVLANSPSTMANLETHKAKKGPVTVVMPTNYVDKNLSSSSSDPPTTLNNALGNPITSEMTKTTNQAPKTQAQLTRNAVTSSPITETRPSATSTILNKMLPPSQLPHQSLHPPSAPIQPPRHVSNPMHMFVLPQASSQSMMHSQARPNYATMHFLGSMHPGSQPPSSMSHMSPPMAHMHPPPMKTMMGPPPSMETHQRPPQPFPVTFTSPPPTSTMSMQTTESESESEQSADHRPSRLLATIINSMTTSVPFTPTMVSSTVEYYTSTVDTDHQESTRPPSQTPLVKILSTEETSKSSPTFASSSITPPRTTTAPSLTTDPIFSHYKQPDKPISGPMYHIIQGHSKVKTYRPTVKKHILPFENNEVVENMTERQLSKLEQLIWQNTKNGAVDPAAEKRKLEEKARAEKRAFSPQHDSLMSLVESGLEGFTVSPSSDTVTEDERRANSVTSVEIN